MGEETVASELERLGLASGHAWRYVHSVPVGDRGSDIDHVLVCPAGVFTINTKAHMGANIWVAGDTFMVNGRRHPYVRNSRFEAERAARLITETTGLTVPVRPLIVVVDPRGFSIREQPAGVGVTTRSQFGRWIRSQPKAMTSHQVDVVFGAVRQSTTWTGRGTHQRTPMKRGRG